MPILPGPVGLQASVLYFEQFSDTLSERCNHQLPSVPNEAADQTDRPGYAALIPCPIRYAAVHQLAETGGWKVSQIARELSCDQKTRASGVTRPRLLLTRRVARIPGS